MKKLMSMVLAAALALSVFVPALAAEAPVPAEETASEPTLTLVVNGVATETALEVENWVTYVDAADAREVLGGSAAAPTARGRVPLRQAAQSAGWDVVWYDGGRDGLDQQVCLWNEEVFRAELQEEFAPFQAFWETWLTAARTELESATPRKSTRTATAELTTFSTLDGSKSYTFRARSERVWQAGVVDETVTLNLADLTGLLTEDELKSLAGETDAAEFKSLLSAAKLEFIADINSGGTALRAPALAFLDPDLAVWQTGYDPEGKQTLTSLAELDLAGTLYAEMLESADEQGGVAARAEMEQKADVLAALAGADHFHQSGSSWTYTLTTDQANAALGKLMASDGAEPGPVSVFKTCELTCHVTGAGQTDVTLALRPDVAGVARLVAAEAEGTDAAWTGLLARMLLGSLDLELKLGASSDAGGSEGSLTLHLNNRGTLKLTTAATVGNAGAGPRQLADVERRSVYDPLGMN